MIGLLFQPDDRQPGILSWDAVAEGHPTRRGILEELMTFRLSHKLNAKIKAGPLPPQPLDENPFADWSAHLFVGDRTQYTLLSNTKSLYSTVLYGRGITDDRRFIERALGSLREFLEDDGQAFVYQRLIAPTSHTV